MRDLALLVGCVTLSPLLGYAADEPPGGSPRADLRRLSSADIKERREASKALLVRRKWLLGELVRLAEAEYESGDAFTAVDSSKELAIDLLGEYMSVQAEALEALLDNLHFRPVVLDACDANMGEYARPAVRALKQVGLPLEPVLEDVLRTADDEGIRNALLFLLRTIRDKRKHWVLDREVDRNQVVGKIRPEILGNPGGPALRDKPSWSAPPPAKQVPTIRPAADPAGGSTWLLPGLTFLGGIAAGGGVAWLLARRRERGERKQPRQAGCGLPGASRGLPGT